MRIAGRLIAAISICFFPVSAFSQGSDPANLPFDPVMGLFFQPAQIAFELAPKNLVDACKNPSRSKFWIYAQTKRPEGEYMVIAGPVWTIPDTDPPAKPVLDPVDSYGSVVLANQTKCTVVGDPDSMFNAPTVEQASIVNELAHDLIKRAVRAYGGREAFLDAMKTQELTDSKVDPILRPIIEKLRED